MAVRRASKKTIAQSKTGLSRRWWLNERQWCIQRMHDSISPVSCLQGLLLLLESKITYILMPLDIH